MPVDVPEDVPEDVPAEDVEGVVDPDEELVIAEGAELGAAACTGEAAAEGEAASTGAANGATEGATDGATDGEAAIEGAAGEAPDAPDPDDPDPDDASDPDDPEDPEVADPDPDPDEVDPAADALEFDPDPDPDAPHLEPLGAVSAPVPNFSTEAPGSGNCTSAESTVSQSLVGIFALNIAGKDAVARPESSEAPRVSSRVAALFFEPPLTLIDAQFMYISRLPILLNQVQARVYDPGAIP